MLKPLPKCRRFAFWSPCLVYVLCRWCKPNSERIVCHSLNWTQRVGKVRSGVRRTFGACSWSVRSHSGYVRDPFGLRSESILGRSGFLRNPFGRTFARGPRGVCSGSIRSPLGVRSTFGVHSGSVWIPFGACRVRSVRPPSPPRTHLPFRSSSLVLCK